MPRTYVVYKIVHIESGKYYVGSTKNMKARRWRHLNDLRSKKHNNITLQELYNDNPYVSFEILYEFTTEQEARDKETQLIRENIESESMLNICDSSSFGNILTHHPRKVEIIQNITAGVKKRYANMTQEERNAVYGSCGESNGMFGKSHSKEAKEKMSAALKGKPNYAIRGTKLSPERCKRIAEFAKTRTGEKNSFFGRHHSEETKETLRAKATGRKNRNCWVRVCVNGVTYESSTEACRTLGISPALLIHRIKSKLQKYENYKYCE